MRLALSSAAVRDASLRELLAGCVRRGLSGLELVRADGPGLQLAHGVSAAEASSAATSVGLEVTGLYCPRLEPELLENAARLSGLANIPVVVPIGGLDRPVVPRAAELFQSAGGRLLLAHGSDARVVEAIRYLLVPLPHAEVIGLAWEIRPGVDEITRLADVIDAAGDSLQYVRLHGGGPESHAQSGMGIGAVMARLTLARYQGPIVLTPSTPSYHYAWSAWLGRGGGWGCGSKQSDPQLTTLPLSGVSTTTNKLP